ncbi:MAG: hypothetical protein VX669_16010 [Planctomycetota bacterium]|nr:hypothetical protein [Planctomycetota bacterium]
MLVSRSPCIAGQSSTSLTTYDLGRRLAPVDPSLTRDIRGGWLITVPLAAIMSAMLDMIAIVVLGSTGCVD